MFSKRTDDEKAAAKALFALRAAVSGVGGMMIRKDPLRFAAAGQMEVPVIGAKVTVDRGEAAKRITATRVALTGIFALALKKDSTKLFVTIEGADGSAMLIECPAKKEGNARKLALLIHSRYGGPPASEGTPQGDRETPTPQG